VRLGIHATRREQSPHTHCNTHHNALQHSATHCDACVSVGIQATMREPSPHTHCNTHGITYCNTRCNIHCNTHCNTHRNTPQHLSEDRHLRNETGLRPSHTLQHTLQKTATQCSTLQHQSEDRHPRAKKEHSPHTHYITHCSTLQHTATHCNTRVGLSIHATRREESPHAHCTAIHRNTP